MAYQANQMGEDSIARLLIRFSIPATAGMIVNATYNIVDTIFVGRLGVEAIAALSVAFPLQMLLGALGIGTGVGAASLISRSLGAGDKDTAVRTVGQIITLSVIYGIIVALIGWFYLDPILALFGATPEIIGLAGDYASVITTGSIMFFLIMSLNNAVRGEGNPRFSMNIMIATAVVNIILDPIFIFVFDTGVKGAAIATVIAKVVGVVYFLHYYIKGRGEIKISIACLRLSYDNVAKIFAIGFPAMIMQASQNVSLVIANNILAVYGYLPIAVLGLIFRLIMFALMPIIGIAQGLLPIIGYNVGAQKMERVREALVKGLLLSTVVVTLFGVIYSAFPGLFLRIFTDDQDVITLGTKAMRIMVMMFPVIGGQIIFTTYFQAAGRSVPSLVLSILRDVIFFIPFLLIFSGTIGLDGVWISRPASDICAFLITLWMIVRELKARNIPLYQRAVS